MLEGAKQEGTSGVAYSRNQPPYSKSTQERHGRLVRRPPAAVNRSHHATFLPLTARTSASGTEDGHSPTLLCTTQMIGVFTRPVKATGIAPWSQRHRLCLRSRDITGREQPTAGERLA